MTAPPDFAARALDARLERETDRPLAVAFSGGGDSLALLLAAKAWTDKAGRKLIAFTVDHQLQAAGAEWATWCASRAARLGVAHRTLVWGGPKPATGLPAAARLARHRLIAEAARQAGARVILFGHTADDVLESQAMRASGVRVSAPREWSPSPVWPEGRELFLLRPLIAARRTALRAWLAAHGEAWIEDPANLDPRQPRARARADLAAGFAPDPRLDHRDETPTFPSARIGRAGEVSIDLAALSGEPAFLAAAIACASGRETLPRAPSVLKLFYRLTQMPQARATLGGTRILARQGQVTVAREIGDGRQGEAPSICLAPGETVIWDGRFEVRARAAGLTIGPLAGRAARLDRSMRDLLGGQNAICRPALPTIVDDRGEVSCPTLVRDPRIDIRGLVAARLAGASGAIQSETNLLSCRDGEPL